MMNQRQPRYSKGQRIGGRFFVHQALMGGMGEVYLCLDEQQMLPFALKTFQGSSPDLELAFHGEVDKWIALEKHPNIVRCFWLQRFDNIPFMVLEWVAGEESRGTDLRSWLRHGPLNLVQSLRFSIDIVRGLMHANAKVPGIVHRDLKPDNVLVNQSRQAKITDFGLAKVVEDAHLEVQFTQDGMEIPRYSNMGGTYLYMAPEQWLGQALDFHTDIYAVGCILYELLTGKWLYDGRTVSELGTQHLEAALPVLNNDLPDALSPILDGCLAKRREDRYTGLDLLLADLTTLYESHSDEPLPEVTAEAFTAGDLNNRGVTLVQLGNYQRAIADYDEAIRLDPTSAPTYINRGNSYAELGNEQRAIADYDEAIRLAPTFAPFYYIRGNSYAKLGNEQRAIADYDEAIRLDPTFALFYYIRGNSYAKLGNEQRAIADYDEAIRLDPTYAQAYLNRGTSYAKLGNYQRAIADYGEAIRLDPTYAQAYSGRGSCYADLGNHQRAIADHDEAIRLNPTYAQAYSGRGTSYADLGNERQAIADYDDAIRLDPNYAPAYNNRGFSYAKLDNEQQAIADYDEAIRLDPLFALAYFNRGNSYSKLGNKQRAIADYDEAIQLDPNYAPAYFNKGLTLANTGRLQESLPLFEKAYALGNQDAVGAIQQVRQMLGLSHLMMPAKPHELQAAFEAFQQASSLDAMRQTVQQFSSLKQMIPTIEQFIQQQVPPEQRPYSEQRLAWLRQIVKEISS